MNTNTASTSARPKDAKQKEADVKFETSKKLFDNVTGAIDEQADFIVTKVDQLAHSMTSFTERAINESTKFVKRYPTQIAICAMALGLALNLMSRKTVKASAR